MTKMFLCRHLANEISVVIFYNSRNSKCIHHQLLHHDTVNAILFASLYLPFTKPADLRGTPRPDVRTIETAAAAGASAAAARRRDETDQEFQLKIPGSEFFINKLVRCSDSTALCRRRRRAFAPDSAPRSYIISWRLQAARDHHQNKPGRRSVLSAFCDLDRDEGLIP